MPTDQTAEADATYPDSAPFREESRWTHADRVVPDLWPVIRAHARRDRRRASGVANLPDLSLRGYVA